MTAKNKSVTTKTKNYLDWLVEISRFPEFRYTKEFAEFSHKPFLSECSAIVGEIKSKYEIAGQPLTAEKAVDIALLEGFVVDTDAENSFGRERYWTAIDNDKIPVLWVNPKIELEEGQFILFDFLSICLLPEAERDLILTCKEDPKTTDDFIKYPSLLVAVMKADLIHALLRGSESESELIVIRDNLKEIAQHLADFLNNPLTPRWAYDALGDKMPKMGNSKSYTPKVILRNIAKL